MLMETFFAKDCFARGFHVLCWFFLIAINRTLFLRSWYHYLKYSTCHVYLQLWPMRYLCICVFVFVHLQVRHLGTLFLRSWYHYLLENIWFLWSKTLHNWENLRCHACDGHTHTCEVSAVFCWGRIRNWCVKLFSFQTVEAMSSWQLLLPKN